MSAFRLCLCWPVEVQAQKPQHISTNKNQVGSALHWPVALSFSTNHSGLTAIFCCTWRRMRRPSQRRWRTVVALRRPCCPCAAFLWGHTLSYSFCCKVWASCWGSGIGSGPPRTLQTQTVTYLRLIDKTHAGPCRPMTMALWKGLLKATVQHGRGTAWHVWINIGRLSTACGRPAQVRLLPTASRKFTEAFITRTLLPFWDMFNPLNVQLNPICHLLALLETHHILHVSRIRVNQFLWWTKQQFIQNYTYLWTIYRSNQSFLCCYHTFPPCILLVIACGPQLFQAFKFRNIHSQIEGKKLRRQSEQLIFSFRLVSYRFRIN